MGGGGFRLPSHGQLRNRRLFIVFLFAAAYPLAVDIDELYDVLVTTGMTRNALRRALHYLYYHYRAVERVSRGTYRMRPCYKAWLEVALPEWRMKLDVLVYELGADRRRLDEFMERIEKIKRYRKLPNVTEQYRVQVNRKDSKPKRSHTDTGERRAPSPRAMLDLARDYAPSLGEELRDDYTREDEAIVGELLHILEQHALDGRPYLKHVSRRRLAYRIQDEARARLGGSSSIAGMIDPERLWEYIRLLESHGLVYYRRYGSEHKLRIDRRFHEYVLGVMREW